MAKVLERHIYAAKWLLVTLRDELKPPALRPMHIHRLVGQVHLVDDTGRSSCPHVRPSVLRNIRHGRPVEGLRPETQAEYRLSTVIAALLQNDRRAADCHVTWLLTGPDVSRADLAAWWSRRETLIAQFAEVLDGPTCAQMTADFYLQGHSVLHEYAKFLETLGWVRPFWIPTKARVVPTAYGGRRWGWVA